MISRHYFLTRATRDLSHRKTITPDIPKPRGQFVDVCVHRGEPPRFRIPLKGTTRRPDVVWLEDVTPDLDIGSSIRFEKTHVYIGVVRRIRHPIPGPFDHGVQFLEFSVRRFCREQTIHAHPLERRRREQTRMRQHTPRHPANTVITNQTTPWMDKNLQALRREQNNKTILPNQEKEYFRHALRTLLYTVARLGEREREREDDDTSPPWQNRGKKENMDEDS